MHVLRRVLQETLTHVVVLDRVDDHRLEAAPSAGDDQWVAGLEQALVPAVLLDADLKREGVETTDGPWTGEYFSGSA